VSRFRLKEPAAYAHGDGAEAEPAGGAEEQFSPGLRAALAVRSARPGCRVLDLGPVLPTNLAFLSRFATHIGIADLTGEEVAGASEQGWRSRLASVEGPFDLVLAWELLSHFDRTEARDLVGWLSSVTRANAALFVMVHEGPEMPARPGVFEIRGNDRIARRPATCDTVAAPTILPAEVARLLAGFRVDSSFLLRHGVREYVALRAQCDGDYNP
jgi:hypothetical protein